MPFLQFFSIFQILFCPFFYIRYFTLHDFEYLVFADFGQFFYPFFIVFPFFINLVPFLDFLPLFFVLSFLVISPLLFSIFGHSSIVFGYLVVFAIFSPIFCWFLSIFYHFLFNTFFTHFFAALSFFSKKFAILCQCLWYFFAVFRLFARF